MKDETPPRLMAVSDCLYSFVKQNSQLPLSLRYRNKRTKTGRLIVGKGEHLTTMQKFTML